MGDAALIPLRLFRIRAAAVGIAASVIIGMAMFGGMFLLPLYWQIVQGYSPTQSGFLMLPLVVGLMVGSISSGRIISRTGNPRTFPIVGSVLMVVGLMSLSFAGADTAYPFVMVGMVVLGLGLGNCMQPLLLILQSAVPPREIGVATSSATFFRQIGGTAGVAIFLSILFSGVGANISDAIAAESENPAWQQVVGNSDLDPESLDGRVVRELTDPSPGGGVLAEVQDDSSIIDRMDPVLAHPFQVGFADSLTRVFRLAGFVGIGAFLILLLLPKVQLRETSAASAVRAEGGNAA